MSFPINVRDLVSFPALYEVTSIYQDGDREAEVTLRLVEYQTVKMSDLVNLGGWSNTTGWNPSIE